VVVGGVARMSERMLFSLRKALRDQDPTVRERPNAEAVERQFSVWRTWKAQKGNADEIQTPGMKW